MFYIFIALIVFTGHEHIPFATTLAHQVEGFLGNSPQTIAMLEEHGYDPCDPLVAAVVAVPYWVAFRFVLEMMAKAGRAGQGGTKGLGDE